MAKDGLLRAMRQHLFVAATRNSYHVSGLQPWPSSDLQTVVTMIATSCSDGRVKKRQAIAAGDTPQIAAVEHYFWSQVHQHFVHLHSVGSDGCTVT